MFEYHLKLECWFLKNFNISIFECLNFECLHVFEGLKSKAWQNHKNSFNQVYLVFGCLIWILDDARVNSPLAKQQSNDKMQARAWHVARVWDLMSNVNYIYSRQSQQKCISNVPQWFSECLKSEVWLSESECRVSRLPRSTVAQQTTNYKQQATSKTVRQHPKS